MAVYLPIISEFKSTGIDKARREFQSLQKTSEKVSYAIKKAALPATAAIAGLAGAAFSFAKAAAEDQAAAEQLGKTLENVTGATEGQIKAVEDYITKLSMASAVADDELRPAFGNLVRGTKDVTRAQELMQTALDISASTGRDLESVSLAMSKAEQGNYNSLKKLGIPLGKNTLALMDMAKFSAQVTKAQQNYDSVVKNGATAKEVAKAAEKLKKAQEKLNSVTVEGADYVKDLQDTFKGASDEAANSAQGGFKRLKIAVDETKESIGAALLPIFDKLMPYLSGFAQWAQDNPEKFTLMASVIGAVSAAVVGMNIAMGIYNGIQAITIALNTALAASFTAVQVASGLIVFTALIAALVVAWQKFEWFRKGVKAVFSAIGDYMAFVFNVWIKGINLIIRGINAVSPFKDIPYIPEFGKNVEYPEKGATGNDPMRFSPKTGGVPAMADGGIVSSPTLALIGEAGPEAVVPLDKLGQMGGTTIHVHVSGGDPNAIVQTLRRYVRQTGSLPVRTAPIG